VVGELARTAQLIAIVTDETQGVQWELSYIFSNNLVEKTLFILPPRLSQPEAAARVMGGMLVRSGTLDERSSTDLGEVVRNLRYRCLAWYILSGNKFHVVTASAPTDVAYMLAIRGFVNAKRELAEKDIAPPPGVPVALVVRSSQTMQQGQATGLKGR
jgi:hypothetical protein